MKKLAYILIALLTINLTSCGSSRVSDYSYIKGWAYKEIPPSQVSTSADSFYEGKLSDGKIISVGGYIDDPDSTFYYTALWQDLGWSRVSKTESDGYLNPEGDKFTANAGSHRPKRGHLYINLERGVAVYFYPDKAFNCFRVKVYPKGTILLDEKLNPNE